MHDDVCSMIQSPFLHLYDGRFGTRLESVSQATLAAVLAVFVEGPSENTRNIKMQCIRHVGTVRTRHLAQHSSSRTSRRKRLDLAESESTYASLRIVHLTHHVLCIAS